MDDKTKSTLTNLDTWKRGLFMVFFSIISGVVRLVVSLVAVFQFITLLFKGETNQVMIPLGQNLGSYLYQITLFLTFKSDEMPFPFLPFPDGALGSKLNEDDNYNFATTEATTQDDEVMVDGVVVEIKDEADSEKETKNKE